MEKQNGWRRNNRAGPGPTKLVTVKVNENVLGCVVPFIHPTGIRHICRFTSLHAADAYLQDRELYRVTVMSATIRYHGPPDPPGLPSGVLVVKVYLP